MICRFIDSQEVGKLDVMTDSSKSVKFMQHKRFQFCWYFKIFMNVKIIYADIKSETVIVSISFQKLVKLSKFRGFCLKNDHILKS